MCEIQVMHLPESVQGSDIGGRTPDHIKPVIVASPAPQNEAKSSSVRRLKTDAKSVK
jgi:hypothetical protein